MNIFEEIAESYKYNGIVSLKAIDDDIVTLENQIDGYNSTLRELQIRGKKSLPLLEKIREAKIRVSLLKAVYKRESDKISEDSVITEILGVSGKNAKETDYPHTAADGKEPVPQNFEKGEIESFDNEQDTIVVNSEKESNKETVINDAKENDVMAIKTEAYEEMKREPVPVVSFKNGEDVTPAINIEDKKNCDVVIDDKEASIKDLNVYKPFSNDDLCIVESVDLSMVTDMMNTMFVYSNVNTKKKLLHVKFVNIRDYCVFVELLKQMEEERRNPLKRLLKKPKSIFIYITTNVYGKEKCFKYEFTNCRIVDTIDGDYASKAYIDNMTDPYGADPNNHFCGVTFKYKKLIIT